MLILSCIYTAESSCVARYTATIHHIRKANEEIHTILEASGLSEDDLTDIEGVLHSDEEERLGHGRLQEHPLGIHMYFLACGIGKCLWALPQANTWRVKYVKLLEELKSIRYIICFISTFETRITCCSCRERWSMLLQQLKATECCVQIIAESIQCLSK